MFLLESLSKPEYLADFTPGKLFRAFISRPVSSANTLVLNFS